MSILSLSVASDFLFGISPCVDTSGLLFVMFLSVASNSLFAVFPSISAGGFLSTIFLLISASSPSLLIIANTSLSVNL